MNEFDSAFVSQFSDHYDDSDRFYDIISDEIALFKSTSNEDVDGKNQHYLLFLMNLIYLINNPESGFKEDYVIDTINFIFSNLDFAMKSIPSFLETAKALVIVGKVINIPLKINELKMLLQNCCSIYSDCPEVFKSFMPFFITYFSNEDTYSKLAKSNIYEFILANVLFKLTDFGFDKLLFDLCFVETKSPFFSFIQAQALFSFFVNSINNNLIPDICCEITAKFIATLISKIANTTKGTIDLFSKVGGFEAYDTLISKFPETQRPSYYSFFVVAECEPPIIDHLLKLYQQNPQFELIYFDMMNQKIRTQTELIQKCKISEWFDMSKPKLKKLFSFMKFILNTNKNYVVAAKALPFLLTSMSRKTIKLEKFKPAFTIINVLVTNKNLTFLELSKTKFLDTVFMNTTPDAFISVLNDPSFLDLCLSVFVLSAEQKKYFSRLCEQVTLFERERFIEICPIFLIKSPFPENIKTLIKTIELQKDCLYSQIFQFSFLDSIDCQNSFVLAEGIEWMFGSRVLDINSVVALISHLVTQRSYEELEIKIISLDHNSHPLFSIDQNSMEKMVYGLNSSESYCPIRIRSLYFYLDRKKEKFDPYNISYLGEQYIDHYLKDSIYNIPNINDFGNRYIPSHYIPLFFQEDPIRLIELCDKNVDHFPIYQFYQDKASLNINCSFVAISFWFKYQYPVNSFVKMFKCDICQILVSPSKIQIVIEDANYDVDVNITQWTHFFFCIDKSKSLLNTYFTFAVNNSIQTTQIPSKKKVQSISNFSFANDSNSILYIGKSFHLLKCQTSRTSINDLYQRGPADIENFDSQKPSIISLIETKNKPSNFYLVSYNGFPKHPESFRLLLKQIKICEDPEKFHKLVQILIAMSDLNPILNWNNFVYTLRIAKIKISFDEFMNFLQRQTPTWELLTELAFDTKLWNKYEAEFQINVLLSHFPVKIWNSCKIMTTFIANTVLINCDSREVIHIVCKYLQNIPNLMKYIVSIIKIAPTLTHLNPTWSQIEFRESSILQEYVLEEISNLITKENCSFFKTYLPFDEMKSLFVVSSTALCTSIFRLISELAFHSVNDNYVDLDLVFIAKMVQLSHIKEIWKMSQKIKNMPILLSLMWSISMALIYYVYKDKPKIEAPIDELEVLLNETVALCLNSINEILSNNICCSLLTNWMPFIFTHTSLFKNYNQSSRDKQNVPSVLTSNQFPETTEELWISKETVLSKFNFPSSSTPLSYSSFLQQIITSIFTNFGFSLPINFSTSTENVNIWLAQSSLLDFFMKVISKCSYPLLESILYSFASEDHINPILSTFVHSLLGRIPTNSIERISKVIEYVSVLSASQFLNQNTILLMSDLFTVLRIVKSKFNEKETTLIAGQIQPIMMSLFNSLPCSDFKMAFSLFSSNIDLFCCLVSSSNSLHSWLFSFIVSSHNELEIFKDFIKKFTAIVKPNEGDSLIIKKIIQKTITQSFNSLNMIENKWKSNTKEYQEFAHIHSKIFQDENIRISQEINQISINSNYFKHFSDVKHLMLALFMCQNLKYFEIVSSIYEERFEWNYLLWSLSKETKNLQPKFWIESKHRWPFSKAATTYQSVVNEIMVKSTNTKSEAIKLYKHSIKFQYHFINDTPINLFEEFKKIYGTPEISFMNCSLKIDDFEIPSILFLYNKKILIQTYSKLSTDRNDFVFIRESETAVRDSFLQNVFSGNFGRVEMFGSQILFPIKRNSIAHIQTKDNNKNSCCVRMWTMCNGCFDLVLSQSIQIKFENVLPYNIPQTKEEVFQSWKNKVISTDTMFEKLSIMTQTDVNNIEESNKLFNDVYLLKNKFNVSDINDLPMFSVGITSRLTPQCIPKDTSVYFSHQKVHFSKYIVSSCLYYTVEIDISKSIMTFRSQTDNKILFSKVYKDFQYAVRINVSANGVFVSIDYSFGYSRVIRIIFKNQLPIRIDYCASFPTFLKNSTTRIMGEEMGCVCFSEQNEKEIIAIFSVINGNLIRKIEIPSKAISFSVDEYNSNIIIACDNGIQIYDNNFKLLLFFEIKHDLVTAITVLQSQNKDQKRTIVCGTESGKIMILYFDKLGVDIKTVLSEHRKSVRSIIEDSEKRAFISIDSEGSAYIWYSKYFESSIDVENAAE